MAQVVALQDGFSAGELSKSMNGQFNNPRYSKGASRIQNFITTAQGPAFFRNGSIRLIQTRAGQEAFLIPFIFSESQAYVLEFTSLFMRVHDPSAGVVFSETVVLPSSGTAIVPGAQTVVNKVAHGLSNGEAFQFQGLEGGLTILLDRTWTVSDAAADTFKVKDEYGNYLDTTGLVYVNNFPNTRINVILEVATPYTAWSDLQKIKYAQGGNLMFMAHQGYQPQKLTRVSATSWTIANHVTTNLDLTGSDGHPAAVMLHEGRLFYGGTPAKPQTFWGSVAQDYDDFTQNTGDTDGFEFTINSERANAILWMQSTERFAIFGTAGGSMKVYGASEEEAITPTSINVRPMDRLGYCSVSPISKDKRLVFAQQGRQRVRALEFEVASEGYEPLDLNVLSEDINKAGVLQMASQEGPPDLVWCVKDDGTMSAVTLNFREEIYGWHRHHTDGEYKSVVTVPRFTGGDMLFTCVQREVDGEAVHFLEVQSEPILWPDPKDFWTGRANRLADYKSWADATYETQKRAIYLDQSSSYDGSALNVLDSIELTLAAVSGDDVIATASGSRFVAGDVGREILGYGRGRAEIITYTSPTVVHVKILSAFNAVAMEADEWYLTADEISGLWDYEGEAVQVVGDGGEHPDCVVADGTIQLNGQYSYVHVGRKYTGIIKTMNIEAGGLNGPGSPRTKVITALAIRFENALGVFFGTDLYDGLQRLEARDANADQSRPTLPINGDEKVTISDMNSRDKAVVFLQEKPYPCTIQAIFPFMEVSAS